MSLMWMLFIMFHALSCPIELKAQLMSQFSINFENYFCKLYVSSLYLLLSHIKVNEKYDLSMTNFENDFCKWYVSSLYLLLSHINVNEKYDLSSQPTRLQHVKLNSFVIPCKKNWSISLCPSTTGQECQEIVAQINAPSDCRFLIYIYIYICYYY